MSSKPIWKHPDDVLVRSLTFEDVLPEGVNLSGAPTYTVELADGSALPGSADDLTAAHNSTSGQVANVEIEKGVDGTDYRVTCQAAAANGETYNRAINVRVRTGL